MRLPRMTTRGIMISIAVVGFSLGLMIKLTLAYSAAVADGAVYPATDHHCGRVCLRCDSVPSPTRSIRREPGEAGVYFIGDKDA